MTVCKHGCDSRYASCANCVNERHREASIRTRRLIAPLTRFLAPLFGHWNIPGCKNCGIHEAVVPRHSVSYNEGTGCSLVCEGCWRDLPTMQKVEIYRRRHSEETARGNHDFTWEQIEMAVRYPYYWRNKTGMFLTLEEC